VSTNLLYLSQIRTAIPSVVFDRVENAAGQFNDVLIVNGQWVFRFPRHREGVARLMAETRLLGALRGQLPLQIPDPQHHRFEPPVPGLAFIGYKCLPGHPITREQLAVVYSEWARDDLAAQLAGFLRALHAIPLTSLPAESTPPNHPLHDRREDWVRMYAEVREKLFPAMRADARKSLTLHFEAYLDDSSLHDFTPALRHGDFGGDNILWDPVRAKALAVIDFSSCGLGDPAMDLASISTLDEDLFNRLASRYDPDPARRLLLLARARFYRGTFALMEALDGLRLNDSEAYQRGMEDFL
jgi:aminoglycoside 2''-phosphotransferase